MIQQLTRELNEQFKRNEEVFNLLVDSVKDYAIFLLRDDGVVATWNQAAQRIQGYAPEEIIGKHFSVFLTPLHVAEKKHELALAEAARHGRFEHDTLLVRKDGTRFWANVTLTALKDKTGRLTGFALVCRNLSASQDVEEHFRLAYHRMEKLVEERTKELRASESRATSQERQLRLITDALPVFIAYLRADMTFAFVNKRCESDIGIPREKILGRHLDEILGQDLFARRREQLEKVMAGEAVEFEAEREFAKNGEKSWVRVQYVPDFDEKGGVRGCVVLGTDVTNQKKIELDLRRALASRDDFLSVASHELKTPITSLKLRLQMAERDVKPRTDTLYPVSKLRKFFDSADRQIDRLVRLIEDLLNVSQIQAGRLEYHFEEVDLSDLVRDVAENFQSEARATATQLRLNLAPDVLGHWDPTRIEQFLSNILSNALKFAPGRPVEITTKKEDSNALIAIHDQGPGITEEIRHKIFERYERGSSKNVGGLGLGLYIANKIIEYHGGTISVVGDPGEGATFLIKLPLRPLLRKGSRAGAQAGLS